MFPTLNLFDGYKTYLAGVGLFGLALYQFTQGDLNQAFETFFLGLSAFGLRHAITKL